jgi:D-arabinose 1-dehydrogenase-like Zn-dependent alcohol dehydrogenase
VKAAVLRAFGAPLTIEEVDDPQPGPGEAVIRVVACGIDGTDLKLLDGFGYTPELPFVMGHEPAGFVESVGEGVAAIHPGDRVIPYIFLIPRESSWFGSEREQLCPDMTGVVGVKGHPGAYAERLVLPAYQFVRIPDGVTFHDAAVHCDAGLTAFHAVSRARITLGETVLVIGVGGVGSFAVQYAKLAGAHVLAIDKTEEKCAWARKLGAEAVAAASVKVDCVLDIVGTEGSMALALDAVSPGGRIVVVGYTPDSFALSGKQLAQNEIEILGSRAGSRRDLASALDLFAQAKIRSIVTDRAPLASVNEALAKLRSSHVLGRMVLEIA